MSDEEKMPEMGFETPVPELDDHRHRRPSPLPTDRPRRNTIESVHRQHASVQDEARNISFENAVVDEEVIDFALPGQRSRRPTAATVDPRSVSPPNSVKAFAEARRRERTFSLSDQTPDKTEKGATDLEIPRTTSVASRLSHRSRAYSTDDAASRITNQSAEEDVCYPLQDEHDDDELHINFELLQEFIEEEERAQNLRTVSRRPSSARAFPDLRPESAPQLPTEELVTADGDFVKVPSHQTIPVAERQSQHHQQPQPETPKLDPRRFSLFNSTWESSIHAATLPDLFLGEDLRGCFTFPKDVTDGVWWVNLNSPTPQETRAVCQAFGVHPLTIEDITTKETREKIELFPSYYFASFRSFITVHDSMGDEEYEPYHMYVIVFREGTLTFSYVQNHHATQVLGRISQLKNYVALSSDWICYAVIDNIVDSFMGVIRKVEEHSEQIEDEVFIARETDHRIFLRRVGNTRKSVMSLMRLLGGKADVLKGFTKRCNENYKVTPRMDIGLYLGDIQDHVVTMMNNLNHCERMLGRAHSNYLAQLSVDSNIQSNEMNKKLKTVTVIASIIVPLNVISGAFGMNVPVPWAESESLVPFGLILVLMAVIAVILLLLSRWRRWI